ncbi:hypothetical protein ASPCADRAFT_515869 [Aspergillus carbonarius ITEM 5010]|uniref:Phosphoglycerate mutase family protein n=1 Tax=Aspergillus carbonarius (strain ITEM 5010) TaxID=602072 RepID=A0A1R3RM08_ASPC5|nr:hypothetical protein ASPCADRAFT_515869 [Aspergillus carbonarius ITEM 5010]
MPLDTIYLTRHGHRLNWTIDYKTGTYHSQFPTPTGNPADPTLTSHGVRQSHELATHFTGDKISPKPFRIYSSPFYRCLQTIQPSVEALQKQYQQQQSQDSSLSNDPSTIDKHADLTVRIEPGLGEWFGPTTFFHHPSPAPLSTLQTHFPTILPSPTSSSSPPPQQANQILRPSTSGETILQLHDRLATTLSTLIANLDTEIAQIEATVPPEQRTSKAVLICSHAAPLIAMGRVLTGNMPEDEGEEDFKVYTAGVSTFVRELGGREGEGGGRNVGDVLAPGTEVLVGDGVKVPDWMGGRGVGGGWQCVRNGDCGFLSNGAERGWHFCGDESFDTGPMADPSATPTSSLDSSVDAAGSKL